jgi:cytochrome oxidase Cu insertion factor (SCO1/SenC/PrrC family)
MTADRTRKRARALLAGLAVIAAAVLTGCASSSAPSAASSAGPDSVMGTAAESNPNIDLGTSMGGSPAPGFRLVNQFGQPTSLSQFRGKVVLLGFEDSECTTVCPLTTQSMVLAKELLGQAGSAVQLLGVDANPGATAVSDVLGYSQAHGMVSQWDFLTGPAPQLKKVWAAYHIEVQIDQGAIDHTPALFVIDQQGRLQKVYLTQMAYSSVGQDAQVVAEEVSSLLPSHPKLASLQSLAAIPPQDPTARVALAGVNGGPVTLGPGQPRLVVFFATWLSETSGLKAEMTALSTYAKDASARHLPPLAAVDETVTESSAAAAAAALRGVGPLDYPVGMDITGRVADGYGVQDLPWLVLVNSAGKVTWSQDGWLATPALEAAVAAHS